jgi:hypothetical protein
VGVWWPNPRAGFHNNIDLQVFRGASLMAQSITPEANFERTQVDGTLATGSWSIRLSANRVSPVGTPQLIYYLVYTRTPC